VSKIILVVEDDEDIRTLLMEVLSDAGYKPTGAPNGKRALEMLENITFDLRNCPKRELKREIRYNWGYE
jgi:DNA-binding response OmpR family regulator